MINGIIHSFYHQLELHNIIISLALGPLKVSYYIPPDVVLISHTDLHGFPHGIVGLNVNPSDRAINYNLPLFAPISLFLYFPILVWSAEIFLQPFFDLCN